MNDEDAVNGSVKFHHVIIHFLRPRRVLSILI